MGTTMVFCQKDKSNTFESVRKIGLAGSIPQGTEGQLFRINILLPTSTGDFNSIHSSVVKIK